MFSKEKISYNLSMEEVCMQNTKYIEFKLYVLPVTSCSA